MIKAYLRIGLEEEKWPFTKTIDKTFDLKGNKRSMKKMSKMRYLVNEW